MELFQSKKERAVAPIIATLLMVAIAVVGGILIFVFTQGFFADEQVTGPTVDNIRINGYDASDGTAIEGYTSGDSITCTGATASATLTSGDCITIFVENLGDKPVAFQEVRIFGESHSLGSVSFERIFELYFVPVAFAATTDCASTAGDFILMTGTDATEDNILEPNEQGTLCVKYGGTTAIKMGRTIPIQIQTANGQSSIVNVFNGDKRGQSASPLSCTNDQLSLAMNFLESEGQGGGTLTGSWGGGCSAGVTYTITYNNGASTLLEDTSLTSTPQNGFGFLCDSFPTTFVITASTGGTDSQAIGACTLQNP